MNAVEAWHAAVGRSSTTLANRASGTVPMYLTDAGDALAGLVQSLAADVAQAIHDGNAARIERDRLGERCRQLETALAMERSTRLRFGRMLHDAGIHGRPIGEDTAAPPALYNNPTISAAPPEPEHNHVGPTVLPCPACEKP